MECIIKFNLPEEEDDMKLALRGSQYYSFIFELDNDLRTWLKHGHEFQDIEHLMRVLRDRIADLPLWDIT